MADTNEPQSSNKQDFEGLASEERPGFISEFWDFLRHNKKWWLLPIVFLLLLVGLFIFLGGTGAAPFIYTLF